MKLPCRRCWCLPTPMTLASGAGVRSSCLWSTSQLLRLSGQQLHHSSGQICLQIQGWHCGAYVGAVQEMVCVWVLQRGHSGDGCDLTSTLCVSMSLRNGDLFVLSWARVANWSCLSSTHSLDHCLWGESDHPAFGPPASLPLHLASSYITPAGSFHKSRGDIVVRMWVQVE